MTYSIINVVLGITLTIVVLLSVAFYFLTFRITPP